MALWGSGNRGQLGRGDLEDVEHYCAWSEAVQATIPAVMWGGGAHTIVKSRVDGSLYVWGWAADGQLGLGDDDSELGPTVSVPRQLKWSCERDIVFAAPGWSHTLMIDNVGVIWIMGSDGFGQCGGLGPGLKIKVPTRVPLPVKARAVAAGVRHSVIVGEDGSIWSMGDNKFGQCGTGTAERRVALHRVPGPEDLAAGDVVIGAAAGFKHSIVWSAKGSVWSVGRTGYGIVCNELNGKWQRVRFPVDAGDVEVVEVQSGWSHGIALDRQGRAWGWGRNDYGQCGTGNVIMGHGGWAEQVVVPGKVYGLAVGSEHALAVVGENHGVYGWGWNEHRQLGTAHDANVSTPVNLEGVVGHRVGAGGGHSMVW